MHSFLLGDRIEMMSQVEEGTVDFILTSPPYNVGKPYKNHHDLMGYDDYLDFLNETWQSTIRVLKTGGRIAINVPSVTADGCYQPLFVDVVNQMRELGFIIRCDILWHKFHISKRTAWGSWKSPSNPHVVQPYEYILVFSKGTKKHEGHKDNIDITREEFIEWTNALWEIAPETSLSKSHPAPFPQELVKRLVKFYTYKGDTVLDMFGGSGTTSLVCDTLARNSIYIDNSKEYYDFAKRRVGNLFSNISNDVGERVSVGIRHSVKKPVIHGDATI